MIQNEDPVTIQTTAGKVIDMFVSMDHPRLDQAYVDAHRTDSTVSERTIEKALQGDAGHFCRWLQLPLTWVPTLTAGYINQIQH